MPWLLALLAFSAGIFRSLQSGSNGKLGKELDQPLLSSMLVLAFGVATFSLAIPFVGLHWPGAEKLKAVPWWAWLGGSFGTVYAFASVVASEKLGAAVFNGLVVAAMMITALILDHFGWLGFEVHPAGWGRIAGALLMLAGFALIARF